MGEKRHDWKPSEKPQSVPGTRYFHKFDPVPGYYYSGGAYAHTVSKAVIHFDTMKGGCSSLGPKLKTYLCTQAKVKVRTANAPSSTYFSYTNAVNPFPCSEAAVGAAYKWMQDTMPQVDLSDVKTSWVPWETVDQCSYHYLATAEAYGEYYVKSYLSSQNEDRSALFIALFFSMWGLFWVHSAYPYYPEVKGANFLSIPSKYSVGDLNLYDTVEGVLTRK